MLYQKNLKLYGYYGFGNTQKEFVFILLSFTSFQPGRKAQVLAFDHFVGNPQRVDKLNKLPQSSFN